MNNDEKSLFIKCDCFTHCLEIQRTYDDLEADNISKKFNLTFWIYGRYNEKLSWKERIQWCWNILKTGKPWSDGIIIDDNKAIEIVNYINKYVN